MPPKIRGMNIPANTTQNAQSDLRRFALMLSGEDVLEAQDQSNQPPLGLPQERFLLGDRMPIAPVLLLGQSSAVVDPNQNIACLQSVHLHATRDHLILMNQNQIDLTESESLELLSAALPLLEEDFQGKVLFHNKQYWFIPAGPFTSLSTHSIDQAHGRNIDWWMPRDSHEDGVAKRWRKLQNEIQMLWHIDPINEAREQRGLPSINSLWISGIGKLKDVQAPRAIHQSSQLCGEHPLLQGLSKHLDIPFQHNIQTIHSKNLAGVFAWLAQPESIWPTLIDALSAKDLNELLIIDFPHGKVRERTFTAKDIYKKSWVFWKKPELRTWKEIISA
jgi:hypothetical protein